MMDPSDTKMMVLVHEGLYGGGSLQTFYILESLSRRGFAPVLVTNARDTALGRKIQQASLPLILHFSGLIQRAINPVRDFLTLIYLVRLMQREKPDVVFTSGVKLIGLGGLASWLCRIPNVAVIRGQGAAPGSRLLEVVYAMERFVARLGTRFITVCEYDRQQMLFRNICPPAQVTTIHNGTDLDRFRSGKSGAFRAQFNIPDNAIVIGMVGRLFPQKRYDEFIRLMAPLCQKHEHVYGLLVGEGEDREGLQALIDELGLSQRVKITGYVADMPDLYADMDLSVLLTRYEGLPNALLESCAAGLPMVADDVCGNTEIIRHGENGYIVPSGDIQKAVQYCSQLIEDAGLRRKLGERARLLADECFDHRRQIALLIDTALIAIGRSDPVGMGVSEQLPTVTPPDRGCPSRDGKR